MIGATAVHQCGAVIVPKRVVGSRIFRPLPSPLHCSPHSQLQADRSAQTTTRWQGSRFISGLHNAAESHRCLRRARVIAVGLPADACRLTSLRRGEHRRRVLHDIPSRAMSSSAIEKAEDEATTTATTASEVKRHPKKKVALVIAYDGTHYFGSQFNGDKPTVERALMEALVAGKLIDQNNAFNFEKLLWSRASRTDRGVHATANVITVKVRVPTEMYDATRHSAYITETLNKHLPPHVRVLDAAHVPGSFSAYHDAVSRVYHYYVPLAALLPASERTRNAVELQEATKLTDKLDQVLQAFVGTHAFHNFTLPSFRAQHVRPQDASFWDVMGIHPSSGKQPARAGAEEGAEEIASMPAEDNTFTRMYDAIHRRGSTMLAGGITAGEFRSFQKWYYDIDVNRTVYKFSSAVVHPINQADLLPRVPASLVGFRRGNLLDNLEPIWDRLVGDTHGLPEAHRIPTDTLVRLTVHGSSFMLHQIRFMVGAAMAVYHGLVPRHFLKAAMLLPAFPLLPLAPPWGLVQAEVNFSASSYVSMYHTPGIPDTEPPVVSSPIREALLNDPKHANPMAAILAADIALLRNSGMEQRMAVFSQSILPKIRHFAQPPSTFTMDGSTSGCMETCLSWMSRLPSLLPSAETITQISRMYNHMAQEKQEIDRRRAAVAEQKQKEVARKLWGREEKTPPLLLPRPVHLNEDGSRSTLRPWFEESSSDMKLQSFRLAEIRSMLLPGAISSALAVATKITKHSDLNDIIRCICWRIAQAEWPVVGSAEAHARWAAQSDLAVLLKEGKLLYWIERAEARNAAAHDYYMRKMKKVGKAVQDEWGKHSVPLLPLEELYEDKFPISRGGKSREPELAKEELEWRREGGKIAHKIHLDN